VRSPSDYCSLKSLLEDRSNPLSSNVLKFALEALSDSSIFELYDEENSVILELHLRTLLATINAASRSEIYLKHISRDDLFTQLTKFAKFYISGDDLRSKDIESISIDEKILMRNYNNDFLLWILRDTVHAISDNVNQKSEEIDFISINAVGDKNISITFDINSQLQEIFSSKNSISLWYSQWKRLDTILQKLINSNENKNDLETREADERFLLEQLWSYASVELKQSHNIWNDITQNINALLRNDTIARSLWFGVLDLSQELVMITQSIPNLVFLYYLVLQSLKHAPNIYIRSKAVEILIIISKKHKMFNSQFNIDLQDILKVFRGISSDDAVKFQKLINMISRRCLVTRNISGITSDLDQNIKGNQKIKRDDRLQKTIYDILAAELTCPITQDMSEQFQKLPCGHFLSVQAIRTWSDECQKKKKLFSCCLCRKEFQYEEIQNEKISAMHQGLYQQLVLVKDISNIQNTNEFKTINGESTPLSPSNITVNQRQGKKKTLELLKKAHPAYSKAKAAIKEEKFPVAIFWLNRLLDNWPDSYSIRCERAYALKQLGDFYQSICDLNIAIHFKPNKPHAWCLLGSVYHQMENYKLALFHVTQALNLEPTNQQGLLTRGIIYTNMNRINDALQDFDALLAFDSQKMSLSRSTSKVTSILQMLHLEKFSFNNLKNKDVIVECLRERSGLYYKKNKFQLAKQDLDRLLRLEPKDRDALLLRGKSHQLMNEFDFAIKDFNKALMTNPKDSWVINRRARCYAEIGRWEEAINDSNNALKYNPSNGYFYTSRSSIVTSFGHLEQALEYANLASIIDMSNSENSYRLAWAYFHLKRYGDAVHEINLSAFADDYDPENAWRWTLTGFILHFFEKEHDDALLNFNKAIELDSDLVDIYCYRGQFYTFRGEYDKALKDLKQAIEMLPYETYLYQNLGHLYFEMGEYNLALEALNNAERLLTGCLSNFSNKIAKSRILTYRGMTYHKLEKYTEALENLNRAIEIQVINHEVVAIVERGSLYYSIGETDKALIDLEEALKIMPINDYICKSLRNAYTLKERIHFSRGQKIEATDAIEKAKALESKLQNQWDTNSALSKECNKQITQMKGIGLDLLREIRAGFENEKIIFDQRTFDKLLSHWEKVLEIDPCDPLSYSMVSALHLMRKNHQNLIKPSLITEAN
jgi:tetratricopeptide (TPR) repeat protein